MRIVSLFAEIKLKKKLILCKQLKEKVFFLLLNLKIDAYMFAMRDVVFYILAKL